MSQVFAKVVLKVFFEEVNEQLHVPLKYYPEDLTYPLQLDDTILGIGLEKCHELLSFIQSQGVDLPPSKIAVYKPIDKTNKYSFKISYAAARALEEIYEISTFYRPKEK